MAKTSAGIALYRRTPAGIEIFLVHFGGPFWAKKDDAAWSFPKGEVSDGEDALAAARREFEEETGSSIDGDFVELQPIKQRGGKLVRLWAVEGDVDASSIRSNTVSIEWPPRSGKRLEIPEVDRAGWFSPEDAARKLVAGQIPFIEQLLKLRT